MRSISFNDAMVRALLAGRKTQTRRPVKPQPEEWASYVVGEDGIGLTWRGKKYRNIGGLSWQPEAYETDKGHELAAHCPYGKPGDLLWVRETWCPAWFGSYEPMPRTEKVNSIHSAAIQYRADFNYGSSDYDGHWRPSIHMPRWASRITLRITDVRVERLEDISEADAIAEGLACLSKDGGRLYKYGIPDLDGWPGNDNHGWHWQDWDADPRKAFFRLWDSIYTEKLGSDSNPWVWVVGFEVVK